MENHLFFCVLSAKIEKERTGPRASLREAVMDKKQKRKIGFTACFIIVCGAVSVGSYYAARPKELIILQRQEDAGTVGNGTAAGNGQKEDGAAETADTVKAEVFAAQEKELCVYVCGAVAKEGVYFFTEGSRLAEAVSAAGGFAEEADRTYHNLAAYLADGQKIYVPTVSETKELTAAERIGGAGKEPQFREDALWQGKVNINTADKELLMTLSGIGEAKAESILAYRQKEGPFRNIEELMNVNGIGQAMFERVKDKIIAE